MDTDTIRQVESWRGEQAFALGADAEQCAEVMYYTYIDLGQLRELVRQGCDITLALRILK
jgi:hypothetical protein